MSWPASLYLDNAFHMYTSYLRLILDFLDPFSSGLETRNGIYNELERITQVGQMLLSIAVVRRRSITVREHHTTCSEYEMLQDLGSNDLTPTT